VNGCQLTCVILFTQLSYLSSGLRAFLLGTSSGRRTRGSCTAGFLLYRCLVTWTSSTWNERCLTSVSVKILTGDTAIPLVPRVMLAKVGTPSCSTSDLVPDIDNPAVWVCVGALAILDRLDEVDHQTLGWWLAERQLANGGLNGRPEKREDVSSRSLPKISDVRIAPRSATVSGYSQRYPSSTNSAGSIRKNFLSLFSQLRCVLPGRLLPLGKS